MCNFDYFWKYHRILEYTTIDFNGRMHKAKVNVNRTKYKAEPFV